MEKDWEARFAEQRPTRLTLSEVIRTAPAKIAAMYWVGVLLVFLGMKAAGFDMIASGAIPIAALTVPWSLLVIAATSSISSVLSEALLRPFISTVGTFFIFPILCGGLNAVVIFTVGSAIQQRRNRGR